VRILILSINYWPEETGIGAFTTCRAEYLAHAGHDVTVCTTFPYYPDWKVAPEYRGRFFSSQVRNGVRILRSYAYIPSTVRAFKRVLHEASFVAASFLRSLFVRRPDLLLVVSPPLGLAASAIFLSKMWRIPYVFDVEDLQPDAAATLGMLPAWAIRAMYGLESAAYRHSSLVSTITTSMRHRIIEKGVPSRKVVLFEPRIDESLTDINRAEGLLFRKSYGLGDRFIVSHSGNMGEKQGLDVIVNTAALCRDVDSLQFLIVGTGAVRQQLERRAADLELRNLRFLPLLETEEFRGLLSATDIALVTQRKNVSDIVFPSKVVTYLGAGKSVVGSVITDSEVARTISDSGAGVVVEPENPGALRHALYTMKNDNLEERNRLARSYAFERWSPAKVLGNLEANLIATVTAFSRAKLEASAKSEVLGSIDKE
jgi:colanic acid biosynthesis glycosyl transferase WcaI